MTEMTRGEMEAHFELVEEKFRHIEEEFKTIKFELKEVRKTGEATYQEAKKTNGRLNTHEQNHAINAAFEQGKGEGKVFIISTTGKVFIGFITLLGAISTIASIYTVLTSG